MVLGIDASNIKAGGGFVHLKYLVENASPQNHGIEKVVIWGGTQLNNIDNRVWLKKIQPPLLLKGGLLNESFWKIFLFEKDALDNCDIVFTPGGTFYSKKIPYVSMSQNMLVFDKKERNRYFFSLNWIRLIILRFLQGRSLSKSLANIYISKFSKKIIENKLKIKSKENTVIYHGISNNFKKDEQYLIRHIDTYNKENPFEILYVSTIDLYKHQWILAEAVNKLRTEDYLPVSLTLIGGSYPKALRKLNNVLDMLDSQKEFIKHLGKVPHTELAKYYKNADLFAFSSSCENLPNIIIEAMNSGLPIISGDYGPMKELLGINGKYYNPASVSSTYESLKETILNTDLRARLRKLSIENDDKFSWKECAEKTFKFIGELN